MSLGGSDYYLIAGDSFIVAAVLMWRGNAWGAGSMPPPCTCAPHAVNVPTGLSSDVTEKLLARIFAGVLDLQPQARQ